MAITYTELDKLEDSLIQAYNNGKPIVSWLTFLEIKMQAASDKKDYKKASLINELIAKEINN